MIKLALLDYIFVRAGACCRFAGNLEAFQGYLVDLGVGTLKSDHSRVVVCLIPLFLRVGHACRGYLSAT